jgi:hypothetical protein
MIDGLRSDGLPDHAIRRFVPYVQMHEFEGLLFSDPEALAEGLGQGHLAGRFAAVRQAFNTPEEINNGPETAPSRRILAEFQTYKRAEWRRSAMQSVGLSAILRECQHFNEWISKLEALPDLATE